MHNSTTPSVDLSSLIGASFTEGDVQYTLRNRSIRDSDLRIIGRLVVHLGWREADIEMLNRYGFSGARLYVVRISSADPKMGIPHVVRVSGKEDHEQEITGWRVCEGFTIMPNFREFEDPADPSGVGDCGIAYPLITSDGTVRGVRDLAEVYTALLNEDSATSLDRLTNSLETAYLALANAHRPTTNAAGRKYEELFSWYLRKSRLNRVEHVFYDAKEDLVFGTARIPSNPLNSLNTLLEKRIPEVCAGAIHGDLHLSNVVLGGTRSALIDFGQSRADAHILIDFVTMESSLRFMMFPRYINPSVMLGIDTELNASCSPFDVKELVPKQVARHHAHLISTQLEAVNAVRKALAQVLSQASWPTIDWNVEYARCLYLILSGQQRFQTFPLLRVIANLNDLEGRISI